MLPPAETLTDFVEVAVRNAVEYRRVQTDFAARCEESLGRIRAHGRVHPGCQGRRQARVQAREASQGTGRVSYAVEFTQSAEDDLVRLYDFLLDRAQTLEELDVADEDLKVIRLAALSHLSTTPYSYRKVGTRSTLRELIVPFGTTGYILRFDIRSPELVLVVGARHQREEDFH